MKRVAFFLIILFLGVGGYIGYQFIWPEILYENLKSDISKYDDPNGLIKALVQNKSCVRDSWGGGVWRDFIRNPDPLNEELYILAYSCTEAGKRFLFVLEDKKECFVRWWGNNGYEKALVEPPVLSDEERNDVWWCFPQAEKNRYEDEDLFSEIFDVQNILLKRRECFIDAWGEDVYRDYLKYLRPIAQVDNESAARCF